MFGTTERHCPLGKLGHDCWLTATTARPRLLLGHYGCSATTAAWPRPATTTARPRLLLCHNCCLAMTAARPRLLPGHNCCSPTPVWGGGSGIICWTSCFLLRDSFRRFIDAKSEVIISEIIRRFHTSEKSELCNESFTARRVLSVCAFQIVKFVHFCNEYKARESGRIAQCRAQDC